MWLPKTIITSRMLTLKLDPKRGIDKKLPKVFSITSAFHLVWGTATISRGYAWGNIRIECLSLHRPLWSSALISPLRHDNFPRPLSPRTPETQSHCRSAMEADVRPGDLHNLDEQRPRLNIKAMELRGVVPDEWISEGAIRPAHTLNTVHSEVQLLTCDRRQCQRGTTQFWHNFEYVWLGRARHAIGVSKLMSPNLHFSWFRPANFSKQAQCR